MDFSSFDRLDHLYAEDALKTGESWNDLLTAVRKFDDPSQIPVGERANYFSAVNALRARQMRWGRIIEEAGKRYEQASLASFECVTDAHGKARDTVSEWIRSCGEGTIRNLVLIGPTGTGKDHLMMAAMREAVLNRGVGGAWCDGQAFFAAVREAYSREETEASLVRFAGRVGLLCMSDPLPTIGPLTPHQMNVMGLVLDSRYRNNRPLIVTVNVATRAELYDRLGDRGADRLCGDAVIVLCNWQSYRQAKAS